MHHFRTSLDNPNYFDVDNGSSPKTPNESRGSGFFIFRKRTSSSNKQNQKSTENMNLDSTNLSKRRGSLKNLLRSRSNSSSIPLDNNNFHRSCCNADYSNPNANGQYNQSKLVGGRLGSYNESNSGADDVFYNKPNEGNKFYSLSHNSSNSVEGQAHARRHSFGTFPNKEVKVCSSSFTDEVPKNHAPKPPTVPTSRYKLNRHVSDPLASPSVMASMDDILVITTKQSELGILWVNYLKACFDKITKQRGRIPFNFLHFKIDEEKITSDFVQRCHSTKLQIVIICPSMLSQPGGFLMQQLSQLLRPERVIGMLLDVTEAKVWDIQKEAFPCFKQWRRCVVRNHDQSFVSDLIGIATDILGRALRQRPLLTDISTPSISSSSSTNSNTIITVSNKHHENFTVIPRKVKVGQNKATIMLTEPLHKDDWIKIRIEKIGNSMDITNIKRRNPYTIHFTVPDSCMEISMMIGIRVFKNNADLGLRPIKCESRLREMEQILKFQDAPMEFLCQSIGITSVDREKLDMYLVQSFQKNVPPSFHLLNSPEGMNGMKINKEASTEEFPTLLHFGARWGLERLCLQLLECPGGDLAGEIKNLSGKTPAELAEMSGHYKLSTSLKNFSKMNEFTSMYHYFKGISESSPDTAVIEIVPGNKVDIETNNNTSTCKDEAYMEMNGSGSESNDVSDSNNNECKMNLNYLNIQKENSGDSFDVVDAKVPDDLLNNLNDLSIKEQECKNIQEAPESPEIQSELTNELKITEPNYYDSSCLNKSEDHFSNECLDVLEHEPDSVSQFSQVSSSTSANTSQVLEADYLIQPSNKPVEGFGDYLTHPSNIPVKVELTHEYMNQMNQPATKHIRRDRETSHLRLYFKKKGESVDVDGCGYAKILELPSPTKSSKSGSLKRQDSDISKKSVDDELLEIINDFKNNVFTIQEVESLVSCWQNRNDVKKSFKDKQDQLQRMREEYERIQQNMKENLKRPSPFERMKKLFSRKNSKSEKLAHDIELLTSNRPISTLSLHSLSSSSSGRMSTGSQSSGSMGDSGTHSDHEERRQHNNQTPNGYNGNSVYRIGTPGSLMENYLIPPAPRPISTPHSTPAEEKSPYFSSSRSNTPIDPEHYILFPSNTPLYPPQSPMLSELNFPAFNDYSNFKLNTIDESKETEHVIQLQPIKIQKKEIIYSELSIRNDKSCSTFKPKMNYSNINIQANQGEKNQDLSSTSFNNDLNMQQNESGHDYMNVKAN